MDKRTFRGYGVGPSRERLYGRTHPRELMDDHRSGLGTPDDERTAEALAVWKRYRDQAPAFIAERIGALALAGDAAGVARGKKIAAKNGYVSEWRMSLARRR